MKEYHVFNGPFLKSKNKTTHMMRNLLFALLPIIIFNFYKNGIVPFTHGKTDLWGLFYPLFFVFFASVSTYLIEWVGAKFLLKKNKEETKSYLKHSYAIFPGLFLALILPIHTPIWILFLGCVIATGIGKLVYGGFGNNIFNPALIGRLFIITMYATVITTHGGYLNAYEVDTVSSATPLTNIAMTSGIGTYDTLVKPYGSLLDFFTGMIPGAVGETSALLCILAFIYLTMTKVIKWRIPVFYIGTVFCMTCFIGFQGGVGFWYPLFQILSGGLFFGAVFMATDPVTSPVTSKGQILYGICLGILTVVFRYLTPYPEGVLTSILTMNLLVFIIDRLGMRAFRTPKKQVITVAVVIMIVGVTSYGIGSRYHVVETKQDPNFTVIDRQEQQNQVIYTVTQKGNGGPIRCEMVIQNGKIVTLKILEHKETPSYYQLVEKADYVETLIKQQNEIKEIDTVSGATVSSNALKKMVINVLQDYGEHYEA